MIIALIILFRSSCVSSSHSIVFFHSVINLPWREPPVRQLSNRRRLSLPENSIGQLERRIARKKSQENHQVLADMKELHQKAAEACFNRCSA